MPWIDKYRTPINGISKFTKLSFATLFSTPLRGRKTQEIISKLLKGNLFICLLLAVLIIAGCGSSNPQSTFNTDTGSHPGNWTNPLAIGGATFHAGAIKAVASTDRGAVLFGQRCSICHGSTGAGKVGPPITGADVAAITAAINVIPLMKGQADLAPEDIQAIAAYLAGLLTGAPPVAATVKTEGCVACHGGNLDGGIAKISCFSCHNGPDGVIGHPAAWLASSSDPVSFHGNYGRRFSVACTTCHGANFDGGIARACAACHNGTVVPILDFIPQSGQPGGQVVTITTALSGAQEVPPVVTAGTGTATLTIDINTGAISGSVTFAGLGSNAVAAHIHQGAAGVNGPVLIPLAGGAGGTSGTWTVPAGTFLTAANIATLKADGLYVNIHTVNNPNGEIRGQIVFSGLITLTNTLSGAQEVPPVATAGTGTSVLTVDVNTGAISGSVVFSGLSSNAVAAHIHQGVAGVNGPVIVPLEGGAGGTSGTWTVPAGAVLTAGQLDALKTNGLYFNVHTATNAGGEIRGQIIFTGTITLSVALSGAQEVPPVVTPATATAALTVNLDTGAISGSVAFSGLSSNATAAHIHQGAAGVNGPVIVPLEGGAGATAGTWTVPAGTFLTGPQLAALKTNGLYFNIHTATNAGGEIRGQIIYAYVVTLTTPLSGAQEVPPVATSGSGNAILTVDLATGVISGSVAFAGLTSAASAAHIHQGATGVNGPVIVPLTGGAGVVAGTWIVPAGTILTADQLTALRANGLYFNIHTATNLGGEIRGQIIFAVP